MKTVNQLKELKNKLINEENQSKWEVLNNEYQALVNKFINENNNDWKRVVAVANGDVEVAKLRLFQYL